MGDGKGGGREDEGGLLQQTNIFNGAPILSRNFVSQIKVPAIKVIQSGRKKKFAFLKRLWKDIHAARLLHDAKSVVKAGLLLEPRRLQIGNMSRAIANSLVMTATVKMETIKLLQETGFFYLYLKSTVLA